MSLSRNLVEEAVRTLRHQEIPGGESLTHYASKYYDPQKAKEYYERTKKLKGREKALSTAGNKVYTVSKANLNDAKQQELALAADKQQKRLRDIAVKAEVLQGKIQEKLQKLAVQLQEEVKRIQEENAAVPLNPIPANASPRQREILEKQNAQIKSSNAAKANKQIRGSAQLVQSAAKEAAKKRQDIGTKMKAAVQKARSGYQKEVGAIQKTYAKKDATEREQIRKEVKDPKPKAKTPTKSR